MAPKIDRCDRRKAASVAWVSSILVIVLNLDPVGGTSRHENP